jgi:hypothetical protein
MRLALLLLSVTVSLAHAGRPLQAEDAAVMAAHSCELEGARSAWRVDGQGQHQRYLQLGCGVGWGTEIALQALQPRELALSGKTQIAGAARAQLTLAWSLGHRQVETAWRRSTAGLVVVASAPLSGDWVMHANLGHQRDELAHRRLTTWALAAEHNGLGDASRWQPMGEVFGDDRGKPWANAALRVAVVADRFFVDASLGRQLGGARARLGTLGFKLAY